jgi:outer membrane protein, heavy metal efflux system
MVGIIILIICNLNSWALSEQELTASVLKHFPLIEEAELKYEASKGEVEAAHGAFDHKLTSKHRHLVDEKYGNSYMETTIERLTPYGGLALIAGHRHGVGNFPLYDGKYHTSRAGEIFAGLAIPLLRNLQTDEARTNLAIARLQQNIALAELEFKQNIYLHKALSLYYKWLLYNQELKVREEALKIAEGRQDMLTRKFKAGDIEKLKLKDNERSIQKRRDELAQAKIEWQYIQTQLSLYYRDDNGDPIIINEAVYPKEKLHNLSQTDLSLNSLPQLKIINEQLNIQEAERKFYDQSRLPELNMELIGSRDLSPTRAYDPDNLQIGLKFSLPLENRKATGKTVAAEYKLKALNKTKTMMEQELKRHYDFSLEAAQLSRQRWEITTGEFQKTIELATAERNRWNQGDSDLYIVNLREQDAAEAEIKRWSTWYKYHLYLLDSQLYAGKIKEVY